MCHNRECEGEGDGQIPRKEILKGTELPVPSSLLHGRLNGWAWILHGRPWTQVFIFIVVFEIIVIDNHNHGRPWTQVLIAIIVFKNSRDYLCN